MTTHIKLGREMVGSEGKDKGVNTSRRNFTRLGAAAPVLMTLASRSALGQDCSPSAMASGNVSHNDISNCVLGISPSAWVSRTVWPGQVERGTYDVSGSFKSRMGRAVACGVGNQGNAQCYQGTKLGQTRLGGVYGIGHPSREKSLLQCLIEGGNGELACCIAALLNGYDLGTSYSLTEDQLLQMIHGTMPIPGGMGLSEYLQTTWN